MTRAKGWRFFLAVLLASLSLARFAAAQTLTVVTFDNPVPPGASDSLLNGVFQGIDFGTNQWRWTGPYAASTTNSIYFASSAGTSRTLTFSPAPVLLSSIRVYTTTNGTLTLSDGVNPQIIQTVTTGSMQLVSTGWTQGSTSVIINFTGGWSLGVDDITYTVVTGVNPPPTVNTLMPTVAVAGTPGFLLTVSGANFVAASVVRWNGIDRPTTFVSTSQLTSTIPSADISSVGTAQVTVFTPAPGGGTSSPQSFSILDLSGRFVDDFNRANSATIGNGWTEKYPPAFSIQNNEVVSIDTNPIDYHDTIVYRPVGEDHLDTEVGLEFRLPPGNSLVFPQVHARVQRNTLLQANTLDDYIFFVDGFEPLPGRAIIARQPPVAGQFECYMLGIPFPAPLVRDNTTRYRLRFRVTGTNPVTLTGFVDRLDGTNWQLFASGTTVHTNATQRDPNLYCDPGFMPPPISTAGTVGFAKWTTNNEIIDNFSWTNLSTVANPVPTTTSLNPTSVSTGSSGFSLTVNGTNFVSNAVVRWNGADRVTTFVSPTQLTATILATDITTVGTASVTVFNPTPGGGMSNAQTFTIIPATNPVPATTSLNPLSVVAGSGGFTLTVNGTSFVAGSVVRWNGADRVTTFVSPTQLTATILATDITTVGTASVTVFNPTPGGGMSNAQTFTITSAPSGGLVAAYGFNEGTGTTIGDGSGNGNTGTVIGTTWASAANSRFGTSALIFNGTNAMVAVNDSSSLDVTMAMTIEAWVYPTVAPSGWRCLVAKEQPGDVVYYLHASSSSGNQPATGVYIGAERTLIGGARLTANTWTHLAATYDGTTQRLYVNGTQVASRAQTGAIQTSGNPLRIGGNSVFGEFFQGRIDEVRIYNRALSQVEIQTDMNTPVNP